MGLRRGGLPRRKIRCQATRCRPVAMIEDRLSHPSTRDCCSRRSIRKAPRRVRAGPYPSVAGLSSAAGEILAMDRMRGAVVDAGWGEVRRRSAAKRGPGACKMGRRATTRRCRRARTLLVARRESSVWARRGPFGRPAHPPRTCADRGSRLRRRASRSAPRSRPPPHRAHPPTRSTQPIAVPILALASGPPGGDLFVLCTSFLRACLPSHCTSSAHALQDHRLSESRRVRLRGAENDRDQDAQIRGASSHEGFGSKPPGWLVGDVGGAAPAHSA
jgi:hypothetical protein